MRKSVLSLKTSEKTVNMLKFKKVTKNIITKKDAYIKVVEVVNLTTFVNNVKGMGL